MRDITKKRIRILKEIGRNAYIDWVMILSLSLLVAIVLVSGSAYLYFAMTKGKIGSGEKPPEPVPEAFNLKELSGIIQIFEEKRLKSENAERGYSGMGDPSQ